jgi:predicted MPP superfamily phosphohydrolase
VIVWISSIRMPVTRRQFLIRSAGALAAAGAAAGIHTWRIEPHWLEIVTRPLPLPFLPAGLEGRTLALLTDLHVGPRVDDDYIIDVFDRVNALQPDYVVFVGDFTSYDGPATADHLARVLEHVPHGRAGSVATLGNHDYGPGWRHPDVADKIAAVCRDSGLQVLRNEIVTLDQLQVVGLDDLWAEQFAPSKALAGFDASRPSIALSHNPDTADRAGWGSFNSWILSGHTHGGQCKPPFLPPPLLPVRNRRYTNGEFTLAGGRQMYISRGVGHLTRVRFNVRPEVTMFRLTAV